MSTTNITVQIAFNGSDCRDVSSHRSLRAAVRAALKRASRIGSGWGVWIAAPASELDGGLLPRALRDEMGAAKWERACGMLRAV